MKKLEDNILKLLVPSIGGEVECQDIEEATDDTCINYQQHSPIIVDTPNDEPVEKDTSKVSKFKWDVETINRFVKMYREEGVQKTCQEFKLKESSCKRYYVQWKKQVPECNTTKSELHVVSNEPAATSTVNLSLTNFADTRLAISKLANIMKSTIERDAILYDNVKSYFKCQTSKAEFYESIRNSIYYSLLDFLNIKRDSLDSDIPPIDSSSQYINTWFMLQRALQGKDYSPSAEYYSTKRRGLDVEWMVQFNSNVASRVRLTERGLTIVSKKIYDLFCIKDAKVKIS
jgi:hypothetical protein